MASKTATTEPTASQAGFWKAKPEYIGGSHEFFPADVRDTLTETREVFEIVSIRADRHNIYKGQPSPRWLLTLETTNHGRGIIGLGMNPQRDSMFEDMQEYLRENPDDGIPAVLDEVLSKEGQPFFVINPPDVERPANH